MTVRMCLTGALLLISAWIAPVAAVQVAGADAQVLLVPLYHASADRQTLLTVENGDSQPKAVLVRLREQQNARPVMEINVYLAPHDLWTAAVVPDADGAALVTADPSCTVPALFHSTRWGGRVPLYPYQYTGPDRDAGDGDRSRLRAGFIEVFDLGAMDPAAALDAAISGQTATDCARLTGRFNRYSAWGIDPNDGILPPRGGLAGSATLLDARAGTSWSIPVTGLSGFRRTPAHASPESGLTLAGAEGPEPGWVDAWIRRGGSMERLQYPSERAIDAVSAVLSADWLEAAYTIDPALDARTEMVLAFPTKWAYVDLRSFPSGGELPPFPRRFNIERARTAMAADVLDANRRLEMASCRLSVDHPTYCPDFLGGLVPFMPPAPGPMGSLSTISVGTTGTPSGLVPVTQFAARTSLPDEGRTRLFMGRPNPLFPGAETYRMRPDRNGVVLTGLPVLGVVLQSVRHANADPGLMASYGIARAMEPGRD